MIENEKKDKSKVKLERENEKMTEKLVKKGSTDMVRVSPSKIDLAARYKSYQPARGDKRIAGCNSWILENCDFM